MMLTTARLVLRAPQVADAPALCAYHARNAARFAPWEPPQPTDLAGQRAWIAELLAQSRPDRPTSFVGFAGPAADLGVNVDANANANVNADAGAGVVACIVGLAGFTSSPPAAMVHYTVDGAYEGRGYAGEAVRAVLGYAFDLLELEEVSAYYHPGNARSGRLLERLGFRVVSITPAIPGFEHLMKPQAWAVLHHTARASAAG